MNRALRRRHRRMVGGIALLVGLLFAAAMVLRPRPIPTVRAPEAPISVGEPAAEPAVSGSAAEAGHGA